MKLENWKKCVLDVVERISDDAYQGRAWFGKDDSVSSPEELLCELFDDYMYDEFLVSEEVVMTPIQKQLGEELRVKLNIFANSVGEFMDPKEILMNPLWKSARESAKKFVNSFKESESGQEKSRGHP